MLNASYGSLYENSYPPARLTLYPRAVNFAITFSQWSPCISIFPSLTVPPEPHNFLSCCASVVSSASLPITPSITVTVFPPCPFRSRLTRTMPSLFIRCGRLITAALLVRLSACGACMYSTTVCGINETIRHRRFLSSQHMTSINQPRKLYHTRKIARGKIIVKSIIRKWGLSRIEFFKRIVLCIDL